MVLQILMSNTEARKMEFYLQRKFNTRRKLPSLAKLILRKAMAEQADYELKALNEQLRKGGII